MSAYDVEALLTARLWVARLGEGDVHRWWKTTGVLGRTGAFVAPRVLTKTHATGRARIAFASAKLACAERYPEKRAQHLFQLDPETEDRLDAYLAEKLDDFDSWDSMMANLEAVEQGADMESTLLGVGVVSSEDLEFVRSLTMGPDGRSLAVEPGADSAQTLRRLAAGFVRSTDGNLAVPYLSEEG